MGRIGQFFMLSAVVIGSLLIAAVLTTSSSFFQETQTATLSYFDSAARSAPEAVNDALSTSESVEAIKRRLYSHHRMVEVSARRRGIDYGSKHLVVIPPRNKALYINYAPEKSTINLSVGGGSDIERTELDPMQSTTLSYDDSEKFRAEIEEQGVVKVFNATQTRSLTHAYMSTESELLRRTTLN